MNSSELRKYGSYLEGVPGAAGIGAAETPENTAKMSPLHREGKLTCVSGAGRIIKKIGSGGASQGCAKLASARQVQPAARQVQPAVDQISYGFSLGCCWSG